MYLQGMGHPGTGPFHLLKHLVPWSQFLLAPEVQSCNEIIMYFIQVFLRRTINFLYFFHEHSGRLQTHVHAYHHFYPYVSKSYTQITLNSL